MKQNSFYQLFTEQLQDIFSAENQVLRALPKLAEAAALPELKEAFQNHYKETQKQVQRLKKIFSHLGLSTEGKTCKGMEGLVKEGTEIIDKFPPSALRDAALISAAQKVEHYEISGYGTARTYAKHLELDQVADLLQESLDEEGVTNKKLNRLAEGSFFNRGINEEARKEETGLNARKLKEINRALEAEDFEVGQKGKKSTVKKFAAKKTTAKKTTAKKTTAKKNKAKRASSKKSTKKTGSIFSRVLSKTKSKTRKLTAKKTATKKATAKKPAKTRTTAIKAKKTRTTAIKAKKTRRTAVKAKKTPKSSNKIAIRTGRGIGSSRGISQGAFFGGKTRPHTKQASKTNGRTLNRGITSHGLSTRSSSKGSFRTSRTMHARSR